ncbi:non-ribosomal peptide synthase/polyketide synthase [Moorena producens]|uniref:non-ribosomal peptide synthase/polyketide synthase n=1 Tax=Moorena producens TaxID=1155739 RepID=UPI003C70DDF7
MNLFEFLQDLVIKGWKLWNEGNRLRYCAPNEESTALVLAQLKQHKVEILQLLRDRPDILNVYPLSYGQKALWFLWQLAPQSHAYNISFPARICSVVDMTAMEKAFRVLRERHPILRTTFPKLGSEPIQQVHDNQELDFLLLDASSWSENELKAKVVETHQQHFDLERGPVMRVRCFTRSDKEHILLLTIHHIAYDRLSLDILLQELPKLYEAQRAGVKISLPPVKHSYQDYVSWQSKILSGTQGEKLWSYWQHQLAGDLPALNLATDRQRPPIQTYNGASHKFKLSSKLIEQLKELAQREGVTFYMMLLAAFKVLLYRYTGQEDILVGSPTSGRSQPEFAPIFGYFVNPVVIRTNLSNNPSFKEFLTQVRQTVLQALIHQDYPFALLVENLQPHRDPSRSPIFQASFALQQLKQSQDIFPLVEKETEKDVDWAGMKLRPFEIPQREGLFDLDLEMVEGSSFVIGDFKYNTDLFDGSTIARMATHFQNLLSAIVDNPQQVVEQLPLLSAQERHQLLVEWNDTASDYPTDKCIHQLVEEQVEKTPNSVAVVFDQQQLTYQQLNQRANQLAHHLQNLGVGPEVLVGICVERSVQMVVGLLGILKAGGAYVPLDPNYPPERLSYMLEDSGVEVLLTQQSLLESKPSHTAQMVCLDSDWGAIEQYSGENLDVGVTSDNLAYVIYTSGSTGQPKGVLVEHKNVVRLLAATESWYHFNASDVWTNFHSIAFDFSVWEIWGGLCYGGRLVIVPYWLSRDPQQFYNLLCSEKVTVLNQTPSAFRQLINVKSEEDTPTQLSLRLVIFGGEALDLQSLKPWFKEHGDHSPQLVNMYGITETTVHVTYRPLTMADLNTTSSVIGRPIPDLQMYILDQNLQPVPIGVTGQMYVGGAGVARGYLNRQQLTEERFIPNPFNREVEGRLYQTGDLARYWPNGEIEYLGRIDNQVKIRGFRIELGEIEAVLSSHPQIQQTVVIATEDLPGHKRLVAYIVSQSESLTTNQLREFLKQKLPDYMVPSAFVTLETLPLTPNGKVDRKSLPAPEGEISRVEEYVGPRTPTEEIIANIFALVLGVPNVGIHDNFFEIGGHSLLATQLISQLRVTFNREIPLRYVFESPTIALISPKLTQLLTTENQLSLPLIQPRTNSEQLPLSPAQERLWFLNQLEGASGTYNIPGTIRVSGNLDINALQQALSEIIFRHEVLRTSFPTLNGTPTQVIHPDSSIKINIVDLQQYPEPERETVLQQEVQEQATTPFDLEVTPLIRCKLWQLDSSEYVLVLTMHHIVSDGWSMGILIQELSSLYQAIAASEPSPLPELAIQYADFALWQRQWLSGEINETQINYWKQALEDAPELLQLPTDHPRPHVMSYQGSTQGFSLNNELSQKLQQLSRNSGSTLFMTLQAAFATLLYRYSGQSDILIGSPIANRNRREIDPLIGFFVNTLVLRTRFEDNPSFSQLLKQVRETTLIAYEHQDVPFEQVVEALQPQRSLSHSPLFQVMFVLQNAPMGKLDLPGLSLSQLNQQSTIAKFDLTLSMMETELGLVGTWEYNTDLFDGSTIARMATHFQNLLSAIVDNPQQVVEQLPLLSAQERHQLLVEWNDTASDYPTDKCIHQLVEEQVEKTPNSVAVVFDQQQLTYQQLNQRANQLAHHLQNLGVGPEVLVGICVERSVQMVVGLLGILKAGGAYVPLDPNYPPERLSYMLEDSGVEVLLTQQSLLESKPSHTAQMVCLDSDWGAIEQYSGENLDVGVTSDNLAYVIYTSGSTGQPKGVLVEHKNVVRLLAATESWYHFNASDVWTNFHSIAFDFSVWEIWGGLCYGGRLVIVPYWLSRDPQQFYNLLCSEKVTVLNQTPSAFRQLINVKSEEDTPTQLSLRLVIFGGEALDLQSLKPWFKEHGDHSPQLVNMYGITETTVHVTYRPLTMADLNTTSSVIGRPIPDLQMYILDQNLQPVPIGVTGQMYVGGAGVARGYLNRQQLTEERFIPNPFNREVEGRLYQTGDLARYWPNGEIEYLGRIDNQVKIRGFRIELGEIEAVLSSHPQIQQTVVIATEDLPGHKRLVAYIVSQSESLTTNQLREFLKQKLPDYMVPSAFVTLETLPLTPNGKVDRKSLPAPEGEISRVEEYVGPRTPTEEIIANIFALVLGVPNVGIHDNFFEIGGHSLLATQLISQLRVTFNREIPLRYVFESPTIALISPKLTQLLTTENQLSLPLIQPRTNSEQLPLSPAQERLWFLNQLEGASGTYNIPGTIRVSGNLDINALQQALSEIIFRHEVLRTSFPTLNGTPTQVIHPDSSIKINIVDLQQYPEPERETVLQQEVQEQATTPFDLEVTPLIRCKLWQLDSSEYVLVLTMHHIVSDGWSMGILIQELSSLYQAIAASEPSPLPELAIQYADFALWQRQWLSGEINETQINYWKQALEDAPELLQLPTDHPRPHVMSYQGSTQGFSLNNELSQKLQQLSRNSGSTLFMTLQAAFATLLYRYSGQSDILIGSPIANRNRREIDPLIGFFVNTLVLRTRFEDNPSFSQLLKQVRETTLIAYEHQDVPFEQVVEALQPQRSLSHSPLFQVMFVLQNAPMGKLDLPGLSLSQLNQQSTIAKFDLTLSMMETELGLVGTWEYNTDLFDGSTIARMATHFQNLLSAIVDNPQQVVEQLPLLSAQERHQLLVEWNDTASDYPTDKCIHQLVEEQVEKTPNSVAVVFDQQQLTYQQLNQRANQLAHHLQNLGVGPEVLVGICVERSVQMVVGLLGILKAGGAYVPLDPNYPHQRLSYMLADSGVEVLLTQQSLVESKPSHNTQMVYLDSEWGAIEEYSQDNLEVGVDSDNLAYVIYTSGSTGKPKGVQIHHKALVNFIESMQQKPGLESTDIFLSVTTLSFDIAGLELYLPLITGARLVIISREIATDGMLLAQSLDNYQVTTMQATPATWRLLLTAGWKGNKPLKILCGGEALDLTVAKELLKTSKQVWNLYGPTEATIWSAVAQVDHKLSGSFVPIGFAINNTQIYILDGHLQPVPIGVPGELYIGGDGLARGYLNRPELTKQKFITNPFCSSNSQRLYKTSDLARYLPDGNIEFIGRIDNQVKIRGFRIELGEIESVLNTHPQIQQTVVIAQEDIPGNKRLVAYYVSEKESLTTNQVREFLKEKLPDYMVPSAFVTLDTVPLTPNGKVDRKSLPAPEGVFTSVEEYVAPRTPTEEIIANIFANVLGVKDVGIHDNFFELGGHSLLATQLISQLRVTFNREIPLRQVFSSPTIALISPKLTQLLTTDNQLSLPPIQPRTDSEQLPLSWAQERLWFLNQLEGASGTYNIPGTIRVSGNLDINALQQALSEIIFRHEVLRTSFPTLNGTPTQVIHPNSTININVVDLQQYQEAERETILQQEVQQEATTPFDLEVAPLIRCKLWQLDSTEYVLVLTMHHIISDGWSIGILIQELSSLYQAFCAGVPSPLPELPIQYADFALWQRQWLSGEILERQLNYWKEALFGAPELLQLPTDRPRPYVMSYQGSTQGFSLNNELSQKLQQLSRNSGSTLFMTLQAAFATLLYRYSGQSDILIGSPIANRNRREIEPLIGFFVNTLVLRTGFDDNPSFSQLLKQVRETTLIAYEHQDVPFEQVVEALQPQRSLSHSPLFQVMFILQNAPMGKLDLPGLTLSELNQHSTIAKFDLTLSMVETDMGLVGRWEYNTDLFDGSTIARMATHFQNLLSAIVDNPQLRVGELPLLSAEERHQLLVEWNDTASDYPTDKCIHQLVEEQVEKTPNSVAVVFDQQQLTYQQLNQRANQLAHHLQNLGVGPEVLVGICVERSVQMVVGLLGILKAGGAYVPLDPNYPHQRLSYMLADSGVEVLLTQQSLLESFSSHTARMVCLDSDWGAIEQHSGENLEVGVDSDNLAYVIYTSGSTGQPKGVLVAHQGLLNLVFWHQAAFEITSSDHATQLAGTAFDAAVWELWPYLSAGASIHLLNTETIVQPQVLQDWLTAQKITITFLPTPLLESLLSLEWWRDRALRIVLTGGDRLNQYPSSLLPFRIINNYGPTENTVVTTSGLIVPTQESNLLPPAIGRPIANTQIYILDKHLQPLPIGVPGELYIGGDGLARGYLNRQELTSEKFITNPFCSSNTERLYKTGDLVRYLRDGNIEFIGRIDNQVKIRGFRIELGEIESVLSSHPHIQQTVVVVTEDIPGNKRLVAYYVSKDQSLTTNQVREFLKQKLPDYMVPSAFVTLDSLPLTPNGKVDRKSLPEPDGVFTSVEEYVAPRTPTEEIIANIFALVLGVKDVGIHDNFFEIGGHSLLATQLISQLRVTFNREIPLRYVFEAPTIALIEPKLSQLLTTENLPDLPPIQPRTDSEQLPLSWAQERLWFLNQLEGMSATYNMPAALKITGNLAINALEQTLSEIINRHEVLRTSFPTVNGKPIQVIHPDSSIKINVVDLQQYPDPLRENVLQQEVQGEATSPFDLEVAPLIRCKLWQLDTSEYVLVLTMHHIVSDGWSMGILIEELSRLYQAFAVGEPSPLPQLAIQYADFALWQRQWLTGEILDTQLNYWKQELEGAPDLLQLPTDRPRPHVMSYRGSTEDFTLSTQLTDKLQQLSRNSGSTLFMTLQAAFATLLYRYSGQSDLLIGSPIANRNRREIEPLIGFFVNTLVLRTRFDDHPSFEQLLRQVRESTLKAYEHQDVPFEQVVSALQPQRSLSHAPLFQVMFILQNAPMGALDVPGVSLSQFNQNMTTSKFDLTLSMMETEMGLVGTWEYNTDLFDRSTIKRMATHFQNLLSAIVDNPQLRVGELPLLSEGERHQLLVEWNDTASDYPTDKCIHQLVEEQVEKTPDAVAVVFEEEQLTYHQLNQRANQLAHHLQNLGVGPEVLVGICVERSVEMVVGLLGILKAGGAYVPLDPNYPSERLSYMLEDSGVEVLLTQQSLVESKPSHNTQMVYLDSEWGAIEEYSQDNLEVGVDSNNLAYVIYTSGSTGKPKGVQIHHKALVNFIESMQQKPGLESRDIFLSVTTLSFDIAGLELYLPLITGARLVVISREIATDGMLLAQSLDNYKVTTMQSTPATWRLLLTAGWKGNKELKILCGGEALDLTVAKELLKTSKQVWNLYGPTEATIWSAVALVDNKFSGSFVPIGFAINNTQIYILDGHLQPVPIGVSGELYIGGDGLARGYLNRRELTKQKFIPNPFNSKSERLYKTGDLARYLPDGNIEFLGRIDNQVKIRGFRIELGEIEAVLSTHPHIQQAAVIAREDIPGNKRLVAYVVCEQNNQSIVENPLQSSQIEQWQGIYNNIYSDAVEIQQTSYNTLGWKSSYTGNQIPQEQMRQWVDSTVEKILFWQPKYVWEIGCGTGMLLFQIAPHCLTYHGTDFSKVALDYVQQQIQPLEDSYSHVSLSQKLADDFTGIEKGRFDAVILNSVVQYFPSIDYLIEVLKGAVNSLTKGGFIFVGDVRSLPLLETFHTATKFDRASDSLTIDQLRQQVKTAVNQEEELVIDPAFFLALREYIPEIKQVQIQLKPGDYQNELTKFRYDVILHVGQEVCATVTPEWLDYDQEGLNLSTIKQILLDKKPEVVGIQHIPNARLQEEVTLVQELDDFIKLKTVGQLRNTLQQKKHVGVEPENLWGLKDELPYSVHITWSGTGGNGCYDAIFIRNESACDSQRVIPNLEATVPIKAWSAYANNPLKQESNRHLVSQLSSFLKTKLPEYMVPSAFVTLDTVPLTPNGKVDRKALPAPDGKITREHKYVAPRTTIELQLTQIWSDVLNLTSVGVQDNFFELGGHSLNAVRLMFLIQQQFQINLPLATLFQSPTIEQLAHLLHSSADSLPWSVLVPIKSHGNQSPLFCIHPGGGNVLIYQDLASYLSNEQPFYGLQSFGLNPTNAPHTSIEQMATHYIQELQTVQPHGPYFISGWSLGGMVAFEMAQQLSRKGEQIALVAILDAYPPSITSLEPEPEPEDDAVLLVELLKEYLELSLDQLQELEPDEQLIYVVEKAKHTNLVPEDFDLAQARHWLNIYKLNVQTLQNYKPHYYSGSIVLFRAEETDADLESTWNELVENLETYVVPGNHQNMVRPPHVKILAEKLQKSLEQAQANQTYVPQTDPKL